MTSKFNAEKSENRNKREDTGPNLPKPQDDSCEHFAVDFSDSLFSVALYIRSKVNLKGLGKWLRG